MTTRAFVITVVCALGLSIALMVMAVTAFSDPQAATPSRACAAGSDVERRLANVLALAPLLLSGVTNDTVVNDTEGVGKSLYPLTLGERLLQWKSENGGFNDTESKENSNATILEFLRQYAVQSLLALPSPKEGSLLHTAAERGEGTALQDLLMAGASLEERDAKGSTALMRAAGAGRAIAVRQLLAAGANAFARDADNATALHRAAQGEQGVGALRELLTAGGRPLAVIVDSQGRTALHAAAEAGHAEAVRVLAVAGVDPRARDIHGTTALLLAARAGRTEAVKELLQTGADVNARDKWQATALHWAAMGGHASTLSTLLSTYGIEVDARDGERATPLHRAAKGGHVKAMEALLAAGANEHAKDLAGQTPRDLCVALGKECGKLQEVQDIGDISSMKPEEIVTPS